MVDLTDYKTYLLLNCKRSANSYFAEVVKFFKVYDEMTQENIDNFFANNTDNWKPNTWNKLLFSLRKYAQYKKLPIQFHKRQRVGNIVREYLKEEELLDIAEKVPLFTDNGLKNKAIILTMFYTGLRPKEICKLKKKDINLENRILIVRNTKGHQDRIVPIHKDLVRVLNEAMHFEPHLEYLFDLNNQRLVYLCHKINEYMKPIVKVYPYIFRHSFAHHALKITNVKNVSMMLGHTSLEVTNIYLNVSQEEACEEYRKCLDKSKKRKF